MELWGYLLVLACTVSLGVTGFCTWWTTTRTTAANFEQSIRVIAATALEASTRAEQLEAKMATWRTEFANLADAVEDTLHQIETKRKRVETAEGRQRRAQGQQQAAAEPQLPLSRDDLLGPIRARVYGGHQQ